MTTVVDMPTPSRPHVEVHGFAMRAIRERGQVKVATLARELGVDRSYITHLENGTKRRVSPEFFAALVSALDVDRRALLANAPEKVPA